VEVIAANPSWRLIGEIFHRTQWLYTRRSGGEAWDIGGKSYPVAQDYPEIAEQLERCFGWPAPVLLRWQLLYDIEVELLGQETFLEDLAVHVLGQELFLAEVKVRLKMLKKDRDFVKKLLPTRLRSTTQ
jgi:hypothetical protein